jgi:hypothetical protein
MSLASLNPDFPNFEYRLARAFVIANPPSAADQAQKSGTDQSRVNSALAKLLGRLPSKPPIRELQLHFMAGCIGLTPGSLTTRTLKEAKKGFPDAPVLKWKMKSLYVRNIHWQPEASLAHPGALVECLRRAAEQFGQSDPKKTAINASVRFDRYRPYLEAVASGALVDEEVAILKTLEGVQDRLSEHASICLDPIELGLASLWGVGEPA